MSRRRTRSPRGSRARSAREFSRWMIAAIAGDVIYIGCTNNPPINALWKLDHLYWYAYAASVLVLSWVAVFLLRKFWALKRGSLAHIRCEATRYFRFFAVLFLISQTGLIIASELGAPRILAQAFFMVVPPLFFKRYADRHIFGTAPGCP